MSKLCLNPTYLAGASRTSLHRRHFENRSTDLSTSQQTATITTQHTQNSQSLNNVFSARLRPPNQHGRTFSSRNLPPRRRSAAPHLIQHRQSLGKQNLHIRRIQRRNPRLRKGPRNMSHIPRIRHRSPPLKHRCMPPEAG
jgi:hypothetical protein